MSLIQLCGLLLSVCRLCCRTALQLQSNVSDELVGELAPLKYLRDLSLRGCTALTGVPTTGFGRLTMLTQLRCLDISNCTGLQVAMLLSHMLSPHVALCTVRALLIYWVLGCDPQFRRSESRPCGSCRPAQWKSLLSCAGWSS